ncbi:MAG TPA: HU family DNA-binding protein [Acidobacteriota bacterium]|nr:HU family DNA-binding protein [Acidobacteriota bacterium]
MNKADLIGRIAKDARIPKSTAGHALDAMLGTISDALKKGQSVTLVGFGTFTVTERKARRGRNPQTRKEIRIPARRVPKFRPGKDLKRVVAKK